MLSPGLNTGFVVLLHRLDLYQSSYHTWCLFQGKVVYIRFISVCCIYSRVIQTNVKRWGQCHQWHLHHCEFIDFLFYFLNTSHKCNLFFSVCIWSSQVQQYFNVFLDLHLCVLTLRILLCSRVQGPNRNIWIRHRLDLYCCDLKFQVLNSLMYLLQISILCLQQSQTYTSKKMKQRKVLRSVTRRATPYSQAQFKLEVPKWSAYFSTESSITPPLPSKEEKICKLIHLPISHSFIHICFITLFLLLCISFSPPGDEDTEGRVTRPGYTS